MAAELAIRHAVAQHVVGDDPGLPCSDATAADPDLRSIGHETDGLSHDGEHGGIGRGLRVGLFSVLRGPLQHPAATWGAAMGAARPGGSED